MNKPPKPASSKASAYVWGGLFLLLSAGPALFPLFDQAAFAAGHSVWNGERSWPLLIRSIGLAAFTASAAALLGAGLAVWMVSGGGPARKVARGLYLFPLLMPVYLSAMAWMTVLSRDGALSTLLARRVGFVLSPFGFWGAAMVLSLNLFPFVTWMVIQSLEAMDAGPAEVWAVLRGGPPTWRRGIFPRLLPTVAAGAILVFAIALAEYAVPALLQFNVFSMEIFAEYSRSGDPAAAAALALPITLPAVIAALAAASLARRFPAKGARESRLAEFSALGLPLEGKIIGLLGLASLVLGLAVPVVVLVIHSLSGGGSQAIVEVGASLGSLGFSFRTAAASGLLASALAAPVAWSFHRSEPGLFWAVCLAPIAVPSPLLGIGLAQLSAEPLLDWASKGPWMLILGHALRFLPVAALVQADFWRRSDPLLWDAAVTSSGLLRRTARLWLPLAAPGLVLSAAFVSLFSLGEIAIAVLLCPPGSQTVALRLFNLLHYGASNSVSALALLILVAASACGVPLWLAIRRRMTL